MPVNYGKKAKECFRLRDVKRRHDLPPLVNNTDAPLAAHSIRRDLHGPSLRVSYPPLFEPIEKLETGARLNWLFPQRSVTGWAEGGEVSSPDAQLRRVFLRSHFFILSAPPSNVVTIACISPSLVM